MKSKGWIKSALSVVSAVAFSLTSQGAFVSPELAAENAVAELQSGISPMGMKAKGFKAPEVSKLQLAYTSSSSNGICFYVYNVKGQSGFVIAPADDRLPAVLAYSETGTFDVSSMPANVKWWMSQYEGEIDLLLSNKVQSRSTKRAARRAVAPMLTTKWNQNAPFNNDCPSDAGGQCVTGCVATAMAQVMKYHNWPPKGKGSIGSYRFDDHVYDWENMIDDYNGEYNYVEASAVSLLMVDCGRSVNMQYSSVASGAQSNRVGVALTEYFDYDPSLLLHVRNGYSLDVWEQTIYDEMVAGRPVYYSGASEEGGHAFVCDGYQGDGFFHFNWGWGGAYDGYFRLYALDPAGGGIGSSNGGYNLQQQIFTRVMPNTGKPCPKQVLLVPEGGYYGSVDDGELRIAIFDYETQTETGFYNYLGYTEEVEIATKWIDMNSENNVYYTNPMATEIETFYGFRGLTERTPGSAGDGTYKVQIVYRSPEVPDVWYIIRGKEGQPQYMEVTIANGRITEAKPQNIDNSPKMLLLDIESADKEVKAGSKQMLRISLANVGDGVFQTGEYFDNDNNYIENYLTLNFADASNPENVVESIEIYDGVMIPANYNVSFMTSPVVMPKAGDYIMSVSCENEIIGTSRLSIVGEPETFTPDCKACKFSAISPVFIDASDTSDLSITFIQQVGAFTQQQAQGGYVAVRAYKADTDEMVKEGLYQATYFKNKVERAGYMSMSDLEPGYYYWQIYFINSSGTEGTMSPKIPMVVYKSSSAADGSISYNVVPTAEGLGASITSIPEAASDWVTIPEQVDGYKTVAMSPGLFTFADVESVSIPAGVDVSSGQFYCAESLTKLRVESATPAYCSPTAFNPLKLSEISLLLPQGAANAYMRAPGWNLFAFGYWELHLADGIEVSLDIDPATGAVFNPYYVSPDEELRVEFKGNIPDDLEVVVKTVDNESGYGIAPDSEGFYTLPAIGNGVGRLYVGSQNSVDGIEVDGLPVDVYTLTGICVGRSMTIEEIKNLPAGVYIAGKRKIKING